MTRPGTDSALWMLVDEGWGRKAADFATLSEPGNCREYVALHHRLGVDAGARLISDENRHVLDVLKIVEPVRLGNVLGSTKKIDHRSVQLCQIIFLKRSHLRKISHPGGHRPQDPTTLNQNRGYARVHARLDGDEAAATKTCNRNAAWIDRSEVRTALALILRENPIDPGNHFFAGGATAKIGRAGWRRGCLRRCRSLRPAQNLARNDDDISVAGNLGKVKSRTRGIG